MARSRKATRKPAAGKRRIEQHDHKGQQRKNTPPVGRTAVKIVDERGIESLKIIPVP
jgi:hypothetical protein